MPTCCDLLLEETCSICGEIWPEGGVGEGHPSGVDEASQRITIQSRWKRCGQGSFRLGHVIPDLEGVTLPMTDTMDSIERIHARAKNKVSASQVARLDAHLQYLKRQKTEAEREKDILMRLKTEAERERDILISTAIDILIERAREIRRAAQDSFWEEFDSIISRGDTIEWYSGWGMKQGTFEYHTDWHVYVSVDGQKSGLPIIIDNDYEKLESADNA